MSAQCFNKSRHCYLALYVQVGKKGFDLWSAHFHWVALVMEEDEALDPVDIGFLG